MVMDEQPEEIQGPKTLGRHFASAWARVHTTRPASFYLLLAVFVMLPLGTVMIDAREDPRKFALYVVLHLVFLFVVMIRAVYDIAEIGRDHLRERERLMQSTLGESGFIKELGRRVADRRDRS